MNSQKLSSNAHGKWMEKLWASVWKQSTAKPPALVVELKWNKSAEGAIGQIKERQYVSWIENYTGEILLVGINYDENKGHTCVIEKYEKK